MTRKDISSCKSISDLRQLWIKENPGGELRKCEFFINKVVESRRKKGYAI